MTLAKVSMDLDELIQQGGVKRIFRAKRKLTVPDVVSHITQRAAGKEPLFLEDGVYLYMLANMKDIARKRSLDFYAFTPHGWWTDVPKNDEVIRRHHEAGFAKVRANWEDVCRFTKERNISNQFV